MADVQQAAQKADAIFYSVNPGGPSVRLNQIAMRAETGMEAIAEATGGTAFIPDGEKDLERVFRQVAAELRGQYLLQYYGNSGGAGPVPAHPGVRSCACRCSCPGATGLLSEERTRLTRIEIRISKFEFRNHFLLPHNDQHVRQSINHIQ